MSTNPLFVSLAAARALIIGINTEASIPCELCDNVAETRTALRCCNLSGTACWACVDRCRDEWERTSLTSVMECARCHYLHPVGTPYIDAVRTIPFRGAAL